MRNPHLEFTAQIGCRVNCMKYCPQEIFVKNYSGEKTLTMNNFCQILAEVPDYVTIIFSGLSEPFQNQLTPAMILEAHSHGHPVTVFSTLVGLSESGAKMIKDVPFERFAVHLPDPYNVATIPETPEYNKALNIILRNVDNLYFMNMGKTFVSDRSEQRVRGTFGDRLYYGKVSCDHHDTPDFFVLPNGDTYFCCQTRGQSDRVGNILEEPYHKLLDKFIPTSRRMQSDLESICHRCTLAKPYYLHQIKKMVGKELIDIGKRYLL